MIAHQIVQKLWSYCNILRDDGLSYSDYVEQLTYLLFLKMADERTRPPFLTLDPLPKNQSWTSLKSKDEAQILAHYEDIMLRLSQRTDLFGAIFHKSASKFRDPAKFRRLVVELIDREEWSRYDTDVKGEAFEGLLERSKLLKEKRELVNISHHERLSRRSLRWFALLPIKSFVTLLAGLVGFLLPRMNTYDVASLAPVSSGT